jgi:hypothetical protein
MQITEITLTLIPVTNGAITGLTAGGLYNAGTTATLTAQLSDTESSRQSLEKEVSELRLAAAEQAAQLERAVQLGERCSRSGHREPCPLAQGFAQQSTRVVHRVGHIDVELHLGHRVACSQPAIT